MVGKKITQHVAMPKWKKSEFEWLKCNFDRAWVKHGCVGGVGVVIRDENSENGDAICKGSGCKVGRIRR